MQLHLKQLDIAHKSKATAAMSRNATNQQQSCKTADLQTSQIAELSFVDRRESAVQVDGNCELEKGIADRFEPLKIEEIVGIGHGQRLDDVAWARPSTGRRVCVETEGRKSATGLVEGSKLRLC